MALKGRKITEAGIGQYGVISAPDRLTGTIPENKRVFDNLVRAVVAEKINGLVDDLSSEAAGASGISQLGMTPIEGMDAENAQAALEELKSQLEQAIIGKAGVASFKGRKGAVVPASGDYTAEMVGAAPVGTGAGYHNSVYRGKKLGTSVTAEQYAAIAAGTFDDLFIGDYWTIGGINYRIAAFDYYYGSGSASCKIHHVTLVPDTKLYDHVMSDTNVTTGAYVGSKMYTEGLNQAKETFNAAFGSAHILNHRQNLQNAATDGYASGESWYDSTVELMNEQNVYGCKVFGDHVNGTASRSTYTVDKSQYPLFALNPRMISIGQTYWLRDVASAIRFSAVMSSGCAGCGNASNSNGVRPAFSIIG